MYDGFMQRYFVSFLLTGKFDVNWKRSNAQEIKWHPPLVLRLPDPSLRPENQHVIASYQNYFIFSEIANVEQTHRIAFSVKT